METVTITKENALKAYKAADNDNTKKVISILIGDKTFGRNNDGRPETFEDACEINGTDPDQDKFFKGSPAGIAFEKLMEVAKALRQGIELSYKNPDQQKWYPVHEQSASGFRFSYSSYDLTHTGTPVGLCVQDEKTSNYFGKQFIDLFEQYKN
jgi:hypothetical protein